MSYPRMEAAMAAFPNHEWEAMTVTTVDGYILTMFKLWNPAVRDALMEERDNEPTEPIFIQHGGGMDGPNWFEWSTEDRPAPIVLADEGYVVYIGNNRGSEYS